MLFWVWIRVGQRKHYQMGVQIPPREKGNFEGKEAAHGKV